MIKDGKDTEYNRLGYFPHYWVKYVGTRYLLFRTTNLRDKIMEDENGIPVSSSIYSEMYELCRKLNHQNKGE